ncbi:hypothetical protein DSM104299_00205 [Baekduia alba]|nr:hypothetical protein DSM104299_00205 [Baekduia alba]
MEHSEREGRGANDPRTISVQDLVAAIGDDTVVALGHGWVFDPASRCIRRTDGRFFDVRMFDRGAFEQPGIYEEPGAADPEPGQPRIVGHVTITQNPRGLVHVTAKRGRGLDGNEFTQATMSSLSNPQPVTPASCVQRTALVQFNPQRIGGGYVRVSLVNEDFPDEQGRTVQELKTTTDGRTLAALAALDL